MISSPSARAGVPETDAAWSAIAVESTKTVRSRPASGAAGAGAWSAVPGVQAGTAMVPPDPGAGVGAEGGASQLVASEAAGAAGSAGAEPSGAGAAQAAGAGSAAGAGGASQTGAAGAGGAAAGGGAPGAAAPGGVPGGGP